MKRTVKKITAIAICCVLAVSSAFVANAKWIGDERDFKLMGETRKISNNQVLVTATGYNESNPKYTVLCLKIWQAKDTAYILKIA